MTAGSGAFRHIRIDRVIHSAREAGVPALLEEAVEVASPAGRIGLLGFSPTPLRSVQQKVVAKELTRVGSRLNRRLIPVVVKAKA